MPFVLSTIQASTNLDPLLSLYRLLPKKKIATLTGASLECALVRVHNTDVTRAPTSKHRVWVWSPVSSF